jgi:thiol-disulfide isomerase/thioredoxin
MKAATIFFSILVTISMAAAQTSDGVTIYFFWGQGCPHCGAEKPFLEQLEQKYPQLEVKEFETWYNRENAELFQKFLTAHSVPAPYGVPTTFIGNDHVTGYGSDATTGDGIIPTLAVTSAPAPTTAAQTQPAAGFEILCGIIGLSLAAYLLNEKKRRQ